MIPILAAFIISVSFIFFNYSLRGKIQNLTGQDYLSQLYITGRLEDNRDAAATERELSIFAASMCGILADAGNAQVQIFSLDMGLLGDSAFPYSDMPVTPDVRSAAQGVRAYRFFFYGIHPYISFSSPIYSGEQCIGAIRYLDRQTGVLFWYASLQLVLAALFATAAWGVASGLAADKAIVPLNTLTETVRQMKDGQMVNMDEVPLTEEMKELALAYHTIEEANRSNLKRLKEEKGRQSLFFSGATHQLKTPLTSIIGYSQVISQLSDNKDILESASYIEQAGMVLLRMAENMLEISKYRHSSYEFHPTWFRLDEIAEKCVGLLVPRLKRGNIILENKSQAIEVFFDSRKVWEVMLNILDNCILHSNCDKVTITTATMPVRMMIQDNGQGIGESQIRQIFEPFYRSNPIGSQSSGLGLAISKEMMTGQGGNLTASSTPGEGTCFTLYFQDMDMPFKPFGNMVRRI